MYVYNIITVLFEVNITPLNRIKVLCYNTESPKVIEGD